MSPDNKLPNDNDDVIINKMRQEQRRGKYDITRRLHEIEMAEGREFPSKAYGKIWSRADDNLRTRLRAKYDKPTKSNAPIGGTLDDYQTDNNDDDYNDRNDNSRQECTVFMCKTCDNILISDMTDPQYNWVPSGVKFRLFKCRDCKKITNNRDRIRRKQNQK